MNIKNLQLMIISALIISQLFICKSLFSQSAGTLSFSVTTTEPAGGYTNKFVLAVWIRDNAGNFVKTKIKDAAVRVQYLNAWVSNSGSNIVDATTGATQTTHKTFTVSWNATDVSAALVPDGDYQVWMQMADQNANGATASVTFTKSGSAVHLTPANSGNVINMMLDWTPGSAGIAADEDKQIFCVKPNPVTSESTINYSLKNLTDVTISVYDVNSKLVKVLTDENQVAGNYSLPLSLNIKPGVYFVKMYTGNTQHTERILITQ